MRVAVLETKGYLDQKLLRILSQHEIKGDLVEGITRQVIQQYDFLVVSHQHSVPNMPVLLERTVLERKIHVIFVTNTVSIGQFHSVYHDQYFNLVQEFTMEVELILTIAHVKKYMSVISRLERELSNKTDQLDVLQHMNKAKRILMENGYTEQKAHQFIQQKAMELRLSKKRLVSLIIENKIDF